jgi:ComF family protein
VLQSIPALIFPAHCRLCRSPLSGGPDLCPGCLHDLPWLEAGCPQCARPLAPGCEPVLCGACQQRAPAFDAATALLHYRPPADYLVQRFKFAGELALAPLLAGLLAIKIAARHSSLPGQLIPVPLHASRLRERGFNQATELARVLGRRLDLCVDHRLCQRVRRTEPQSTLPIKQRHANLRNAFTVNGRLASTHVAIVDDVMTSGHTSGELARILKQAGARRVEVWVIARAGH